MCGHDLFHLGVYERNRQPDCSTTSLRPGCDLRNLPPEVPMSVHAAIIRRGSGERETNRYIIERGRFERVCLAAKRIQTCHIKGSLQYGHKNHLY